MIIWGMVGNSHDASLAVFENKLAGLTDRYKTKLLWASLAKDFSKIEHDPDFNQKQIDVAIGSFGYPDKIQWYERPRLKTLRQLKAGQGLLWRENNISNYLKRWNINVPIFYTQHHESHAAYAYYTQPHDDCAVICLDSIGEFETLTIWHGKDNKLKKIYSQGYPHSLGLFYSAMTQRLGLVPQRDEYIVAQMAEKGDPNVYMDILNKDIIDYNYGSPKIRLKENLHRGCKWWMPEIKSKKELNNLAASTQATFELALDVLQNWASSKTKSPNLALAGGGALNKQAVDLIRNNWTNVWVPPNPGDPGSCIGSVLAQIKIKIELDNQWYKAI